jgi:hypothetical protein
MVRFYLTINHTNNANPVNNNQGISFDVVDERHGWIIFIILIWYTKPHQIISDFDGAFIIYKSGGYLWN